MKQTTLNMLSNHLLSIITGFLAGMVFVAGMSNVGTLENKDYWQSIGSLSAGFGTLAILVFGWLKANEWRKQIQSEKLISLIIDETNSLAVESNSFYRHYISNHHDYRVSGEDLYLTASLKRVDNLGNHKSTLEMLLSLNRIAIPTEIIVMETKMDTLFDKIYETDLSDLHDELSEIYAQSLLLKEKVLAELLTK